jgi:hypothetical protein
MGRRMGGMRYLGRTLFGSKSLNRRSSRRGGGRDGYDSLFDAFSDARKMSGGSLDEGMWEEYYTEVIDSQKDKAGNSGQETLLGDDYFGKEAKQFCRSVSSSYNPEAFISSVKNGLGDDYYNAISEITEECAIELVEAWDRAYRNDGVGEKLFGGYGMGGSRRFSTMESAFSSYTARAARNFGANWNTTAGATARSAAAASKFLASNPGGTARRSIVTSSYRAAAARNGKRLP